MSIVSTTLQWKGLILKVEDGKVYVRSFGTTALNHSMHWGWQEIPIRSLKDSLQEYLKDKKLI